MVSAAMMLKSLGISLMYKFKLSKANEDIERIS
jgi:hypothetical protein